MNIFHYIPTVLRKRFGSIYPSVHKQLIRTLFEAHIVSLLLRKKVGHISLLWTLFSLHIILGIETFHCGTRL